MHKLTKYYKCSGDGPLPRSITHEELDSFIHNHIQYGARKMYLTSIRFFLENAMRYSFVQLEDILQSLKDHGWRPIDPSVNIHDMEFHIGYTDIYETTRNEEIHKNIIIVDHYGHAHTIID